MGIIDNMLRIEFTDELSLKRGDFGAEIKDGTLHLPVEMIHAIRSLMLSPTMAETFMGAIWASPDDIAALLNWTEEEVKQARDKIIPVLRGHVHEDLLKPVDSDNHHGLGTLPPDFHP